MAEKFLSECMSVKFLSVRMPEEAKDEICLYVSKDYGFAQELFDFFMDKSKGLYNVASHLHTDAITAGFSVNRTYKTP